MNKMHLNQCTVAIIAGGLSKRFGSPKYLAKIGNRRLIDMAIDVGNQLSLEIMIISGLPEIKQGFDLPVFEDVFPQSGPLAGIHSALAHCKTDWLAVLPVDMPLLKAEFYHRLWENRQGTAPVVAQTNKGIEPMVSLWPRASLSAIQNALQKGQFKIHEVLEQLSATYVTFQPEESIHFFNVNYPQDLALIQNLVQGENNA